MLRCRSALVLALGMVATSKLPAIEDATLDIVALPVPAAVGSVGPALALTSHGVVLSWLEPLAGADAGDEAWALRVSRLEEGGSPSWSAPATVHAGTDFWPNWADVSGVADDLGSGLPSLVAHRLRSLGEGTYTYGIEVLSSQDGGSTWKSRGLLHEDRASAEHGFVSWASGPQGARAFWLDGRGMPEGGAMALRTRGIGKGGETFDAPSAVLDDRVCECCQTDAAATAEGEVVVYRDRSTDEVRDIAIVRRSGKGWSEPAPVHVDGWRIDGCPVNGPAVAARGERVWVAWYTAAQKRPRVLLARSGDAGRSFASPVAVDDERPLGRVDVAVDDSGAAWVSWLDRSEPGDGAAAVRVRRVEASGELGATVTVGNTSGARASGFPRLAPIREEAGESGGAGEGVVIVWVESTGETGARTAGARLRSALVRFPSSASSQSSRP